MTREKPVLRVLMVEDDVDAARLFARRLAWSATADFRVSQAPDLQSALACIEHDEFDALLLDLSLPDAPATSTLAAAGAISRHLPIVVLTGTDDDDLAVLAARLGVQDYLVKDAQDSRSLSRAILAAVHRHPWVRAAALSA